MSTDVLEYATDSTVEAKIEYWPVDALPAGLLVVRDANNQVRHKIVLTPDNIGTWIDLTDCVRKVGRGIVEAELLRTIGNGRWSGKLLLRAQPPSAVAEDVEQGKQNHLDPSVLFWSKP
jgi:hypothetical protein